MERVLFLANVLNKFEYNVFSARDGMDTQRIINAIMPNLIVLNLRMPPFEGRTFLENIRSEKGRSIIKIIVTSGPEDLKELESSLNSGAEAFLTWPVSPTGLYRTIHFLIEPNPRQHPRLKVIFKARVEAGGQARGFYATALSEGGLFMRTAHPLPAGTDLKVLLDLPGGPAAFDGKVLYNVDGVRKYIEPGMGVGFVNMGNEARTGLRRFIEDQFSGISSTDI